MNYSKPKIKKLYEEIAEIVENKIISKELLPGDRLESVEQLSNAFDVSRSVIREALTILQAKNLIEIRHGEGTFIREQTAKDIKLTIPSNAFFSKNDLLQIFDVRKILELGIIENAAQRITIEQLNKLKDTLNTMENNMFNTEISSEADMSFHTIIAEAAHNPLLVSMLQSVSQPISKQIQHTRNILVTSNHDALKLLHNEHIAIYNALQQHDVELANQTLANHLNTVKSLFL